MVDGTVLLVESSLPDSILLQAEMKTRGCRKVLVAANTSEAEEILFHSADRSWKGPVDLVIVEKEAPPEGGTALLRKVRASERTKAIPVVVVYEKVDDDELQDIYLCGANSLLERPADAQQLATLVAAAARYWLRLNLGVPQGPRAY